MAKDVYHPPAPKVPGAEELIEGHQAQPGTDPNGPLLDVSPSPATSPSTPKPKAGTPPPHTPGPVA